MERKFEIQYMKKNKVYSIRLKGKKYYSHKGLAKILHLNMVEYEKKLKNDFNASQHPKFNDSRYIYFINIEDAKRAKEWLEGLYIMNKLLS